jgi:outer membrane protein OmpA-like peptidoglycan-associated protein
MPEKKGFSIGFATAALILIVPALLRAQEGAAVPPPEPLRCALDDAACVQRAERQDRGVVFTTADGTLITDPSGNALTDLEAARRRLQEPGQGAWRTYDFEPGPKVLFATDFASVPVGRFPADQLEYVEGSAQVVEKDGSRVLELTDVTRFRVNLPDPLPEDFTLEFAARTGAPNMRINVFFVPRDGPIGRYEHPYVSVWRDAGIALKGRSVSSTDSYLEIVERMVPVRYRMEGEYAILYLDAVRAANMPSASIPRSTTIEFEVDANRNRPAYLGEIVVASGGGFVEQALAESGSFTTRGIVFTEGGDALRPESTAVLERIRRLLESSPDLAIVIEDHTVDDLELSERRANAIARYLLESGIVAERVTAVGKAGTEAIADATTPSGRLENRRVQIRTREEGE